MTHQRTVILHYHLFKNAGSSFDEILKKNFGDQWVTREFSTPNNTESVVDWIQSNPNAVAFSSHTMSGLYPEIPGINIISVIFMRNPIKRIVSAYKFERSQPEHSSFGSELAHNSSFEKYVVTRLRKNGDYQCRNFQSEFLSTLVNGSVESKYSLAKRALEKISFVGIVEKFNDSLSDFKTLISAEFPDFQALNSHANKSKLFDFEMSIALDQLLQEVNRNDQRLWRQELEKFNTKRSIT